MLSRRYLHAVVAGFVFLFFSQVLATPVENPVKLLNSTVIKLQTELNQQHATLAKSPKKLYEVVKKIILPIVDIPAMSGLTLGPKWRNATPAQQKQFINQFGLLVTRTYAKTLLAVADYKIEIDPLRGNGWKKDDYVAVHGTVYPNSGGSPSSVTYYLVRNGHTWKIYDFAVEGVSFVQNFHSQFQGFANMTVLLKKVNQVNGTNG